MLGRFVRVLLDANLLISYLLTPERPSAPTLIVTAALNGAYRLILTDELRAEVRDKVTTKRYLRACCKTPPGLASGRRCLPS